MIHMDILARMALANGVDPTTLNEPWPPRSLETRWCPTCGCITPDGLDCQSCAEWWAANPPPLDGLGA